MTPNDIQTIFQNELADSEVSVRVQSEESNLHVLISGEMPEGDRPLEAIGQNVAHAIAADVSSAWTTLTVWVRQPGLEKSRPAVHLDLTRDPRSSVTQTATSHSEKNDSADEASPQSSTVFESQVESVQSDDAERADTPTAAESRPVESPSSTTAAISSEAELDLGEYCFISNTMLLTHHLPPPGQSVAKAVAFFDKLDLVGKRQMLPALSEFFQSSHAVDCAALPDEMQEWFETAKTLDERTLKSLAVWLSRYCLNPESTSKDVDRVLHPGKYAKSSSANQPSEPTASPKNETIDQKAQTSDSVLAQQVLPLSSEKQSETHWKFLLSRFGAWNTFTLAVLAIAAPILFGITFVTAKIQRASNSVIQLQIDN